MSNWTVDREDAAYMAGLFEGEGSIVLHSNNSSVTLSIGMTDKDVLEYFQELAGVGKISDIRYGYGNSLNKKPFWTYTVCNFEEVQYLIAIMWYWLGDRRREQCKKVLTTIAKGRKPFKNKGRLCSITNCIGDARKKGMCNHHYNLDYNYRTFGIGRGI